jgi:hypothetical protein
MPNFRSFGGRLHAGRQPAEQVVCLANLNPIYKAPSEHTFVYPLTAFIRLHEIPIS